MPSRHVQTSKFLSYVLRHNPGALDLELDPGGWVDVEALVKQARKDGRTLSREHIERVIAESDKQRFTLSADGQKIRANYGHSVDVNLDLEPAAPPERLFHGTARRTLPAIREEGLRPQSRQFVHLSATREEAKRVGQRHGTPVVLVVRSGAMHAAGHTFYEATDAIWLTEAVPPRFIEDE